MAQDPKHHRDAIDPFASTEDQAFEAALRPSARRQ